MTTELSLRARLPRSGLNWLRLLSAVTEGGELLSQAAAEGRHAGKEA
jgi:hypothetical protein